MNTVIKYETFNDNDEFVKWQKETQPNILTIAPMYKQVHAEQQNADTNMTISSNVGVFVTYHNSESINIDETEQKETK